MTELEYTPMTLEDLPAILEIERDSFPAPWSKTMFERDILYNKLAHPFTVRRQGEIVGYYSVWKILEVGHLVTLAVGTAWRRLGLGGAILREAIHCASRLNIRTLTLEVRQGNRDAIRLYTRFGFIRSGIRPKYYDDGEDAWIMDYTIPDSGAAGETA